MLDRIGSSSLLLVLTGAAMSALGCSTPTPANDAATGADTGPVLVDAGRDAAATPDTGLDTGPAPDTGTDAGSDAGSDGGTDAAVLTPRTTATSGSAIVLSSDDAVLVACNRQAGSVSIFHVNTAASPPTLGTPTEIAFAGAEPWAAVIGNDDDTAYVILRRSQQIVRITDLHGTPALASGHGTTGSEPTGLAISPLGTRIWVANWGEGTLSGFSSADLSAAGSVDLNAELVASGSLGTVTARPGLAHPRAIVMTNDGDSDETDESIYVTEYFAQTRVDTLPVDDSRFDVERRGLVYRVDAAGAAHGTIPIMPIADTGFVDSNGATTGCYPNQLLAAGLASGRLYVTAVCASPRGPVGPLTDMATGAVTNAANFKTEVHTGIFVVDTTSNMELPTQHVLLTRAFQQHYDGASPAVPDDGASRRIPLIANDIAFIASGAVAYVPGYGSDAVFRVQYNVDGSLNQVGASVAHFINLSPAGAGMPVGRLPYGIAIGHTLTNFAFTINEHSRNVSILSLASQTTVGAAVSSAPPAAGAETNVLDGRRFFVTGLGRWSFRGQGWNSCEACHGDGLTDTVTWYFGRGPRQSTSLDGTFDSADPTQQRLLNWTAIFDEVHDFENNTRGNSGGVGAVVHATSTPAALGDRIIFDGAPLQAGQMAAQHACGGLNGSISSELMPTGTDTPRSALADWDHVREYIATIRSPRAPISLVAADVTAGAALFASNNCAACHGTHMWTISRRFWSPDEAHNAAAGSLRTVTYTAPAAFPAALNPPSMGGGRTASLRFPAGATAGANDQIQCILRAVGTFPASGTSAILPASTTVALREVRQDMSLSAQGLSGFNPPSLLDGVASAPYFHGGNARTLEEVFDTAFAPHHTALSANFLETDTAALRATHVRQLVAFLLSIDESTTAVADPTLGYDPRLCPATLP